jgi:hypothetical protein
MHVLFGDELVGRPNVARGLSSNICFFFQEMALRCVMSNYRLRMQLSLTSTIREVV